MLFYLTNSLIVSKESPEYSKILMTIKYLGIAAHESYHLLLGDIEVIRYYRDAFIHDNMVFPVLNDIYQNEAMSSVPREITYYIEIVKDNPSEYNRGNTKVQQLLYTHFDCLAKCHTTILLGEDQNDATFYNHILEWYKIEKGIKIYHKLDHRNGGGGNTARELSILESSSKICIAIIDTDIRYPGSIIKDDSTAHKCQSIHVESPISHLYLLEVHELENLVPLNYIVKREIGGGIERAAAKKHLNFLRKEADDILPYYDFKRGLKISSIISGAVELSFAQKCFDCIPESERKAVNIEAYIQNKLDDQIFVGFGTSILPNTLDYLAKNNFSEAPVLLDFQRQHWIDIAQKLLDWGIARNTESFS